jgi:hypothetical protein
MAFGACKTVKGSGNVIEEVRNVRGFDGVALEGSGTVLVTQGGEESLLVEAEDNIMPYIETKVEDGILVLGFKDDRGSVNLNPTARIVFHVGLLEFHSAAIGGSGSIESKRVETDRIALEVAGSGDVDIKSLEANELTVDLAGSGHLKLRGKADEQTVNIAGSGTHDCPDLSTRSASVNVSGSGNAVVRVTDELSVNIAGSGEVEYHGDPQVSQSVLGSGSVRSLD